MKRSAKKILGIAAAAVGAYGLLLGLAPKVHNAKVDAVFIGVSTALAAYADTRKKNGGRLPP